MALDLDHVREIVERVTASQGLELWDLEFHGGGKGRLLRIFIDKPEGVTHEDCAHVSREVGTIFQRVGARPGSPSAQRRRLRALHRQQDQAADARVGGKPEAL